ncbi:MAG: hypothetical protein IIA40_02205 [SAR324 cluster bacterium]|nr:hypothetical protein [SAR324 cluster bacterium]
MEAIDIARAVVGAMCCGMPRSGLQSALDDTARRRVFGRPVADFQAVRWQLADVATNREAARLLTYRAAQAIAQGEALSGAGIEGCRESISARGGGSVTRSRHPPGQGESAGCRRGKRRRRRQGDSPA